MLELTLPVFNIPCACLVPHSPHAPCPVYLRMTRNGQLGQLPRFIVFSCRPRPRVTEPPISLRIARSRHPYAVLQERRSRTAPSTLWTRLQAKAVKCPEKSLERRRRDVQAAEAAGPEARSSYLAIFVVAGRKRLASCHHRVPFPLFPSSNVLPLPENAYGTSQTAARSCPLVRQRNPANVIMYIVPPLSPRV